MTFPQTVLLTLVLLVPSAVRQAAAKTANGNDFALYLSEARNPAEEKDLIEEAVGHRHFFRYLQVMSMDTGKTNGSECVTIKAFEPASYMDICFTVTKPASLRVLADAPETVVGKAIAVTGRLVSVDKASNSIRLDPVIVRHKDVLSPVRGKELLCEVDTKSAFYSYTGGRKIVSLTYKDRDLLRFKSRVLAERGKQGWADFLAAELAKRRAARGATEGDGKAGAAP